MPSTNRSRRSVFLWILQGLLALLFLFAGAMKLAMPADALASSSGLPAGFLRFIGVAELAGGLGLVLPGLFRIARHLTVLAASGLLAIMTGAVVVSAARLGATAAILPLVTGVLLVVVIRGRREWLARRGARTVPALEQHPAAS